MKNIRLFVIAIVIAITGLFSCTSKSYVNTTEVFNDGSCNHTMMLNIDSSKIGSQQFPVIIDSSWKQNLKIKTPGDNQLELSASKSFKHVDDINKEIPNDSNNWSKLDHSVRLEKKFRWFYSYLTYTEIYKKVNPFELVPVTDYISHDELQVLTSEPTEYLAGRDSAEIEKIRDEIMDKAFIRLQASIFEEFIQTLNKNVHQLENPAITSKSISENRDTILASLQLKDDDISDVLFDVDSLLRICSKCMGYQSFEKLKPSVNPAFKNYIEKGEKIELVFDLGTDDFQHTVIMPGLLMNTNCKTVIGNKIQWQSPVLKCFFKDYSIYVTSRVTNRWAFIVSGFFMMLLILGLVAGSFLKKRQ